MTDWTWHRRAQDSIAQSYLTNSKRPESLVKGVYPTHAARGKGAYLYDHSGKAYLDFICGLGANLLGYGDERIASSVAERLRDGISHSLATHHEVEAAEKLKELFPFVDAWKFLKSGTEACSAAVRIARAKTGRPLIFSEGYHGWSDSFVSLTPPALGGLNSGNLAIIKLVNSTRDLIEKAAAVIIEPVITDWSPERLKWLQELREDCTKHGVLLIFDEVITGLRFPKYSVAAWSGITPDLIIIGKAMAGGLPLAAVGGKYATMNCGEYFVSSTYAGDIASLTACKTVATLLQTKYDLAELWKQGQAFLDEFSALWPGQLWIEGYPSRGVLKAVDLKLRALFMQEACKAGILFGPSWFFGFQHIPEWRDAMKVLRVIVERLKRGEVELEGEMPSSPFAQKVRETA